MKKVLIWDNRRLANVGGPSGYLYNIHEFLKIHPNNQIVFLSDLMKDDNFTHPLKSQNRKQNGLVFNIKQIINIGWRWYNVLTPKLPENIDLNEYEFIHIHKVQQALAFRNLYPNYKGKLIVTSHCPVPSIDEFLSAHKDLTFMRPIGIRREVQCFECADYWMFPCMEAREPYEQDVHLRKLFGRNEEKMFYVPSSINDIDIDENKMQRFSELGIPEDAFVISYFGRHNQIKGYDILKKLGSKLLDKYPNLYFVCGGKGEIDPLNHDRWIELGFINNTHELLFQSDLYISANRETYFDLVILEILRSSTKVVLANTGGNKFFKTFSHNETNGIDYFDINNFKELVAVVEKNINKKISDAGKFMADCKSNRDLFLKYFTVDKYVERYLKAINALEI